MELDTDLRWNGLSFSSDCIAHSFRSWERYQHIIKNVNQSIIDDFISAEYTIGAEVIFPNYRVPGVMTINQARGCNSKICDRIDLTLECIRRYYSGYTSPLHKCLTGYKKFFDMFVDFRGYIDFFHFQDFVTEDYSSIKYLTWQDGFESSFPLPRTVDEYEEYLNRVVETITKRNSRIDFWTKTKR